MALFGERSVDPPRRALEPNELDPVDRAERLAGALTFERITDGPPPIWRGICTRCETVHCEITVIDDAIAMLCMRCEYQPNWLKLEHDVYLPGEPSEEQIAVWQLTEQRRLLLRPDWLTVDHGPRYDELDDIGKAIWDRTRGQVAGTDSKRAWIQRLVRGVAAGIITRVEAKNALDLYDKVRGDEVE